MWHTARLAKHYYTSMGNHAKRISYEVMVLGLSLFVTVAASFFLPPLRENPLLYYHQTPDALATSDMSQFGWPLPFRSSYTIETSQKTIPAGSFDIAAGIIDAVLLYIAIRLLASLVLRRAKN